MNVNMSLGLLVLASLTVACQAQATCIPGPIEVLVTRTIDVNDFLVATADAAFDGQDHTVEFSEIGADLIFCGNTIHTVQQSGGEIRVPLCIFSDSLEVGDSRSIKLVVSRVGSGNICETNPLNVNIVAPSAPAEWTCDPFFFDADDGCDCNCGPVLDPDCETDQTELFGCPFSNVCESDGSCGATDPISQCIVDNFQDGTPFFEKVQNCPSPEFDGNLPDFNTAECSQAEVDKLAPFKDNFQCIFDSLPINCQDSTTDIIPLCNFAIDNSFNNISNVTAEGSENEFSDERPIPDETKQCFKDLFCANAAAQSTSNGIVSAVFSIWITLAPAVLLLIQFVIL